MILSEGHLITFAWNTLALTLLPTYNIVRWGNNDDQICKNVCKVNVTNVIDCNRFC